MEPQRPFFRLCRDIFPGWPSEGIFCHVQRRLLVTDVLCCMILASRRPDCATVQVPTHLVGPTVMSVIVLEEGDDTLEFENKAPQQQLHVLTIK